MKRLVRSRSPRDRSQYCRGLHTSGRETTASARSQCSARERRPVRTGSNLCLSTLYSQRISIPKGQEREIRGRSPRHARRAVSHADVRAQTTKVSHPRAVQSVTQEVHSPPGSGTVLYTALFVLCRVPPYPSLTPWFHPWLHDLD